MRSRPERRMTGRWTPRDPSASPGQLLPGPRPLRPLSTAGGSGRRGGPRRGRRRGPLQLQLQLDPVAVDLHLDLAADMVGTCSLRVLAPSCTSTWPPSASAVAIADRLSAACWRVRDSVRLTSTSDTGALRSRPDESPGRLKAARGLSVGKGADRVVTRDGCSNSGFGRSSRCSWTAAPGLTRRRARPSRRHPPAADEATPRPSHDHASCRRPSAANARETIATTRCAQRVLPCKGKRDDRYLPYEQR